MFHYISGHDCDISVYLGKLSVQVSLLGSELPELISDHIVQELDVKRGEHESKFIKLRDVLILGCSLALAWS